MAARQNVVQQQMSTDDTATADMLAAASDT